MRARKSCDACHSRKIKCDLALPKCDWCYHRNIPCTFMGHVRDGAGNGDKPTPLITAFTGMDQSQTPETVTPSISHGSTPFPERREGTCPKPRSQRPRFSHLPGVRFGKLYFAGHDLGNISSYNGIPFFTEQSRRWIHSCTGQDAVFPELPGDLVLAEPQMGDSIMLPNVHVVETYLSFFGSSHLKLEFPVVDSAMFRETIRVAYGQCPSVLPSETAVAKASVFAFLSVVTLFEQDLPAVDGNACAMQARHLLTPMPQEISITTLQAALMLSIHQLFSGQIPSCAISHSLACRIMFMLGGHIVADPWTRSHETEAEDTTGWSALEKKHLRKLFWLCYTLDKEISLRTGQPPAISDDHCDLTLPDGYLEVQYLDEYLYADMALLDESAVPLLPADIRLTLIKSKTCKLLYSAEALRKSDADLLRDIRELDEELERWRISVPQKYRPVLSLPQSSMGYPGEGRKSVRTILINFEYQYLMATIHQATSRCRAWAARESHEMDSVRSSLALAVEASRSTLLSLRTVYGSLDAASWVIVFYPMSAVVTIFCNILCEPLHSRAREDLELLDEAPELIRCIRRCHMTENDMVHLTVADDFIVELARLGKHAVSKARHELEAHNHLRYWGV